MSWSAGSKAHLSREVAYARASRSEAPTLGPGAVVSRTRGSLAVNYFEGTFLAGAAEHPCPIRRTPALSCGRRPLSCPTFISPSFN